MTIYTIVITFIAGAALAWAVNISKQLKDIKRHNILKNLEPIEPKEYESEDFS